MFSLLRAMNARQPVRAVEAAMYRYWRCLDDKRLSLTPELDRNTQSG